MTHHVTMELDCPVCQAAVALFPVFVLHQLAHSQHKKLHSPQLSCQLFNQCYHSQKMQLGHHRDLVCHTKLLMFNLRTVTFAPVQTAMAIYKPKQIHVQHICGKYFAHTHVLICQWLINWQPDHGCNTSFAVIQCNLFLTNELFCHESGTLTEYKHWHSYLHTT